MLGFVSWVLGIVFWVPGFGCLDSLGCVWICLLGAWICLWVLGFVFCALGFVLCVMDLSFGCLGLSFWCLGLSLLVPWIRVSPEESVYKDTPKTCFGIFFGLVLGFIQVLGPLLGQNEPT